MPSSEAGTRTPGALGHWIAGLGYLIGAAVLLKVPTEFRWSLKRGDVAKKSARSSSPKKASSPDRRVPKANAGPKPNSPLKPRDEAETTESTSTEKNPPNPAPMAKKDLTVAELKRYDGSDETLPVLLAARGVIYDVTAGRDFYGKGGAYNAFAGKDCSRALAKMSLSEEDVTGEVSDLTEEETKTLDDWIKKFEGKYPVVGNVL